MSFHQLTDKESVRQAGGVRRCGSGEDSAVSRIQEQAELGEFASHLTSEKVTSSNFRIGKRMHNSLGSRWRV